MSQAQANAISGFVGGSEFEVSRIQKIIGQRMMQSKLTKPCFYLQRRADITDLNKSRRKYSRELGVKITTNDFFLYAMAHSVRKYPLMAGTIEGSEITIADSVNVGFAVAAPQGLVVPVIHDAHEKSITQIARESEYLTEKARANALTPDDLNGACITVSSLGMFGVSSFMAIVPVEAASILAIGRPLDTPMPKCDTIMVRKMMSLSLTVDHRLVNGAYAARFLDSIVEYLENPLHILE